MMTEKQTTMSLLKQAVQCLVIPGDFVEIRIPQAGKYGTISGYFDNQESILKAVAALPPDVPGIYVTLNGVHEDLLSRAYNRTVNYSKHTTTDKDIIRRRWLAIDLDAVRPAGISSTDEEHQASHDRAKAVRAFLQTLGWPDPIYADSGNGAHLLYRIDMPNDEETRERIKLTLEGLSNKFSDEIVKVDKAVFNAARIWKLYGTMARKGDNMPRRPHRLSQILEMPEYMDILLPEQMMVVAAAPAAPAQANPAQRQPGNYNGEKFNIDAWIAKHGISIKRGPLDHEGGRKWLLNECAFNPEHRNGEAMIGEAPMGGIFFKCQHDSCSHYGWEAYREKFDGPKQQRQPVAAPVARPLPAPTAQGPHHVAPVPGNDNMPVPTALDGTINATEDQVAAIFEKTYQHELRFDHDEGRWYIWDGKLWQSDRMRQAFNMCRELCRTWSQAAAKFSSARTVASVEKFAQAAPCFAVRQSSWDQHQWLVGTPNGTINLITGELLQPDPAMHITKSLAVIPAPPGTVPHTWLKFLDDATRGDAGLIRFLQQMAGYALSGSTEEHALFFIYGDGQNGKSVFLNAITGILGDYAQTASMDTFTASKFDKHTTDLAMLKGARLVTASETEENRKWAEARVKQMTGGDPITARFMAKDNFTYNPEFKLVIVGNHMPRLHSVDAATRRRFNIIPFVHSPTKKDTELGRKLRDEWPAILRWMIDGCIDWNQNGLVRPEVVAKATEGYFEDQDLFGQWLDECTEKSPLKRCPGRDLFISWQRFAKDSGEYPGSSKTMYANLRKRGYKDTHTKNGNCFEAIQLLSRNSSSFGRFDDDDLPPI